MSSGNPQALFFLGLPDLKKLVCVTLSLQEEEEEEQRSRQLKTCRELVLLYSDVLACPALDSFSDITAVMAMQFFHQGVLQAFAQRNRLKLVSPQSVSPGDLQCCLSYSLIARLAPRWNKAGLYLLAGKDFLTERRRLSAVSLELSTCEGQLRLSLEANSVRLPPAALEDFELPTSVLRRFCSDPGSVLNPSSTGGAVWCHVLPSMKRGQIVTISRQLPRDGPFRSYVDLQNHWNRLYGYRLPDLAEDEVVYCSVFFRPLGERLFTYPLICIRLQPVQRCPRADLQGALSSFLSDFRDRLQSVCGFPARLTSKPCYHTVSLTTAATVQITSDEQINLASSVSIRSILTQLSAPPSSQPVSSCPRLQTSSWTPLSQQEGAQGFMEKKNGNKLRQSQTDWSSSSHSSSSSCYQSDPSCSFSSSFLPPFHPASSHSVLPPLPPSSQTSVHFGPKMVPIFRNKDPSRHINVALLRVQKEERLTGKREESGRVTLPAFGRKTPAASSSSAASLPLPPPIIPQFIRRPKPHSSTIVRQASDQLRITHISSLSPVSGTRPGIIVPPKPEIKAKTKSIMKTNRSAGLEGNTTTKQPPVAAADASDKKLSVSSKKKVVFEKKDHKSMKPRAQDEDVETMARNNQLLKLSSATLLSWLRQRGVPVGAKHRKEELMMKVTSCLSEA